MEDDPLPQPNAPDSTANRSAERPQPPNYTARRILVAVLGVALVAAGVFVVSRLLGSDDDASSPDAPTWDSIVVVDRVTGDRRVLDAEGNEVATASGPGRVRSIEVLADRLAMLWVDRLTFADVTDSASDTVEIDRAADVRRLPTGRALVEIVGAPTGGRVSIIDGGDAEVIDVAAAAELAAPLLFPDSLVADAGARTFAVADGGNFQTVVVSFDDGDAQFFPDRPLAISEELVVTTQNVGSSAEIGIFERGGNRVTTVASARPVGGVLDGDRFVYVTTDGDVLAIEGDAEEAEQVGEVTVPTGDAVQWVRPVGDGQRLVVAGRQFQAVVELDGSARLQTTFVEASTDLVEPWYTWACVPIGPIDAPISLVNAITGAVVADLRNSEIESVGASGCGIVVRRDDGSRTVFGPNGSLDVLPAWTTVVVSPDGTHAVVADGAGNARLEVVGSDEEPFVDLGVLDGLIAFAQR